MRDSLSLFPSNRPMKFTKIDRINTPICALVILGNVAALFAMPHLLAANKLWGLLFIGTVWITLLQWALLHEGIHKILFSNLRANELTSRLIAVLMGTSFHALRFGHLMHHQLNRKLHPEQKIGSAKDAFMYYLNLTIGVYAYEVLYGWILTLLPRHSCMDSSRSFFLKGYENVILSGERFFYIRGNIHLVRMDTILSIALYAGAFYAYGPHWPWLVMFLGIRALVLSFMDNIYHFDTPRDNSKAGKELAVSPALSMLLLHGNYHETHHLNPTVHWVDLPAVNREQQRGFDGGLLQHGLYQLQPLRT
jgi:fatty acid desaturase